MNQGAPRSTSDGGEERSIELRGVRVCGSEFVMRMSPETRRSAVGSGGRGNRPRVATNGEGEIEVTHMVDNERSRDLGEQPLASLMAARELKPKDLVIASTEQLTHKMVTRALKGRRLTAKAMGKVHRAMEHATSVTYSRHELFNYNP